MSEPLFGFLNVYKPVGMTSHDVVAVLRRITKIKQIGHTGTLDPFAEGVLPICIGKSTRLIEYLEDDKSYIATVNFGKATDSYDIDGKTIYESEKVVSEEEILSNLKFFEGEISQMPPIYSAIKINGKKLYEYARKGEDVEIQPRKVCINEIKLISFDEVSQVAQIFIACSKGTYIRSIAHDLGQKLGCGAFLSKLIRANAGKFELKSAVKLDDLISLIEIKENLINPLEMLPLEKFEINDEEHKKVMMGQVIENRFGTKSCQNLILIYNDKINAVASACENFIKVKKVFE